jgi:hypothetical protein
MSVLKVPTYIISIKARPIRLVIRETKSASTFKSVVILYSLACEIFHISYNFFYNEYEKILVFVLKTILQFVPSQYLDVYNLSQASTWMSTIPSPKSVPGCWRVHHPSHYLDVYNLSQAHTWMSTICPKPVPGCLQFVPSQYLDVYNSINVVCSQPTCTYYNYHYHHCRFTHYVWLQVNFMSKFRQTC